MSNYRIISITKGKCVKVDNEDFNVLNKYKWYASHDKTTNTYYARRRGEKMHRVIMGNPKNRFIDHINHDTLDNRRSNLRLCDISESSMNRNIRKDNKSGYIGVIEDKRPYRKKWLATIVVRGKHLNVGNFNTKEEAAYARDQFAIQLHGEFATLNLL